MSWLKIESGYLNTDHVVVLYYNSIVMSTGTTVELLPNEFKELKKMIEGTNTLKKKRTVK